MIYDYIIILRTTILICKTLLETVKALLIIKISFALYMLLYLISITLLFKNLLRLLFIVIQF